MTTLGNVGYARLRKLLADYKEKIAAIETTLALLGESAQESATSRAEGTLHGALKLERERKLSWSEAHSPQERERRHGLIRDALSRGALSMDDLIHVLHGRGLILQKDRLRQIMHDMRDVERVGSTFHARWQLRQPTSKTKTSRRKPTTRGGRRPNHRPSVTFDGTTAQKAFTIATVLRENGGALPLTELAAKSREQGIEGLTGMANYVRAGWLRRTRVQGGKNGYRLVKMPPEPPTETPAEA